MYIKTLLFAYENKVFLTNNHKKYSYSAIMVYRGFLKLDKILVDFLQFSSDRLIVGENDKLFKMKQII